MTLLNINNPHPIIPTSNVGIIIFPEPIGIDYEF